MSVLPLKIGMIGLGVVGTGVAKLLSEQQERLTKKAGRPLVLKKVAVRDTSKSRDISLDGPVITNHWADVVNDSSLDVVVELAGGTTWTKDAILGSLSSGKHIVTANKALLATHGKEVFDCARKNNRCVAFEASVAGGIPIIGALTQGLAANKIIGIRGILNGTCNFILTSMSETGGSYQDALKEAQKLGFAESDPTMDVDGTDTAHKLAILVQIAFGQTIPLASIDRVGISSLNSIDIHFARELGYGIKLLAEAWIYDGKLAVHVSPVLLRRHSPLAQVRQAYNAIQVMGDAVGDTLYYGLGAGRMPTASSVVADIIDIAVGRAQSTFNSMNLWSDSGNSSPLLSSDDVNSRYYLRLLVDDKPGVLADVTKLLAKHQISIASIIQHEAEGENTNGKVQLVIMTHLSKCGKFRVAAQELDFLDCVSGKAVHYPVED
jgi:homoserine dehydrogenase